MTTIIDSAAETSLSTAAALLKAAVSGGKPSDTAAASKAVAPPAVATARSRPDPLTMGLAGAGLALGTLLGAGTAIFALPRTDDAGTAIAEVRAGLEATRLEASRLVGEFDRLTKSVVVLKDASEAARGEAKARGAGLTEKVGKAETALSARIAALTERVDQAEKDQSARIASLAAQAEKRSAAAPTPMAKIEPAHTGSLAEPKAKPATAEKPGVIEGWAVRDVYDGTAILEDRRRRLVEVGAGASIPGIGRVEAVERRGRDWVVVTRQGIVTPQPW